MITIKSASELVKMQAAGRIVGETLKLLGESVRPGVTTAQLDKLAHEYILSCGAKPSFLGYAGYPGSVCISVNNQVIHGIPGKRVLKDGDIVSCDTGAILDGFHGDAARTFLCGEVKPEIQQLVRVTRECFFEGLKFCRVGYRISDISKAVQQHAERYGYGVVRDYVGHGIGREMHEDPEVPNYYSPRARQRLHAGMAIAVEPMINLGTYEVKVLSDGWTVETVDGLPSAHFENTILITEGDPVMTTYYEGDL
ncbi:MAG: type I methionyl aminopeptidase [Clostridia bacterium]|nr:type I methionyl aminopeptidase [Clostridia bacterium]MBQ6892144.1 type I methionyl aminopeptidase [Clostridia bacterium]